jgi:DNA-binding transcriptional MocR family regulator
MNWKLRLKPNGGAPLYAQIESAICAAINAGALKEGERIPSVIELSRILGINKLTVVKAFQKLEKAGLVRSAVGRGTFISIPASPSTPDGAETEPAPEVARSIRRLREGYARGLRELMTIDRPPGTINLSGGVPNPDTVSEDLLERLCREVLARNPRRLYEYAGPAGLPELREAISQRLAPANPVAPDEIILTNGSQQGLSLAALAAREDGRVALCETPAYSAIPSLFMMYGDMVQSVARQTGSSALNLDQLSAAAAGRRVVVYVCPDFQNPTGETMSAGHRRDLAQWARRNDALFIVDEIFRDLRFEGEEPPSLYAILPPGRRILVSSISKTFMTGLRSGFLAADRAIVNELLAFKRYVDLGGPSLTQAVSAAFLREGYDAHLERVRAAYRAGRDAAIGAMEKHMPKGVSWTRPEGGFQLWVTMPPAISSIQLFLQAAEQGVSIVPGPAHDVDGRFLNCFRLGYGYCAPEEIRKGVARLARIVERLAARTAEQGPASGLGIMV